MPRKTPTRNVAPRVYETLKSQAGRILNAEDISKLIPGVEVPAISSCLSRMAGKGYGPRDKDGNLLRNIYPDVEKVSRGFFRYTGETSVAEEPTEEPTEHAEVGDLVMFKVLHTSAEYVLLLEEETGAVYKLVTVG